MLKKILAITLAGAGLAAVGTLLYAFVTNQSADVVIGHEHFTQTGENGSDPDNNVLNYPYDVYTDGTRLFIAENNNHRVLIYNEIPATYDEPADVVIGQPDMLSNQANQGGETGPNTLCSPRGVYVYGNFLFIADTSNNRVLIYNSIPTKNNTNADVVIGQENMTDNDSNHGGLKDNSLSYPYSVSSCGSKLLIADASNHRVLIYNAIPAFNYVSADVVVGQPNMTSNSHNQGGSVAANTLYSPYDVNSDGTRLFIADYNNHRVLIYNTIPGWNNASANVVVGQPAMNQRIANNGGIGANTLFYPYGVNSNGTKLFIADAYNHRVLIYNTIPGSHDASANVVLGQKSMSNNVANQGLGEPSPHTLYYPLSVCTNGTRLFIGDTYNHRILMHDPIPTSYGKAADLAMGQPDMYSGNCNQGSVSAHTLDSPYGIASDGARLYIADRENNRILIYNSLPQNNHAQADVVIGQADMVSNKSNRGGGPTANSLAYPRGVYSDGKKFYIADTDNNRVLIYNSLPHNNNVQADVVIGQPDMVSNACNQGGLDPGPNTLCCPYGVYSDGTRFYIADSSNNRVLIFNTIPNANNTNADVVIGQQDMAGKLSNQGNADPTANTLSSPISVKSDGSKLYIADYYNNRVLIYNSIPTTNNASADIVIGQQDMTGKLSNQGNSDPAANTLKYPWGISLHDNRLCIADRRNYRVLIYDTIPMTNNANADAVIGQPDMTSRLSNQGGNPGANTLYYPAGMFSDAAGLYITDTTNHRALIFQNPLPAPTSTPIPIATLDIQYKNEMRAYNNRFNPDKGEYTVIRWYQSETVSTTIKVYDLLGELIATLAAGEMHVAGQLNEIVWYGVNFAGSRVGSGIYIVHIEAGRYRDHVKVAIIK